MNTRAAVMIGMAALAVAAGGSTWWRLHAGTAPGADAAALSPDQAALPVPPVPPRIAAGTEYEHCLGMLDEDPAGAKSFADGWAGHGGGDGALHCAGLADIALGDPAEGASTLQELASASSAPALERAAVLGQAAQAWMVAGEPNRARQAASAALALSPEDPDLLIDRANADMALDRYQDALDDLTAALARDGRRSDALILQATALRHLNRLAEAEDDIERAIAIDPNDPDALLERGILRQRRGDRDGARRDWQRIIALSPDSQTADLAQQNLALLEAGPDRR